MSQTSKIRYRIQHILTSEQRTMKEPFLPCQMLVLHVVDELGDPHNVSGFTYTCIDRPYSRKASSLVLLKDGSKTASIARTAKPSRTALMGRCTNTHGLPRESSMARRKYSSIKGPRMNASNIGAGSQQILEKR